MINPQGEPDGDPDPLIVLAKSTFMTRKLRGEIFDSALLGEPAWDIVLVLFAMDRDHGPFSVADLANEIDLPTGSVGRWLKILADRDLVHFDGLNAELSAKGCKSLKLYLKRQVAGLMEILTDRKSVV